METTKDALTPLHPPAPTAPPVVDASHDADHDKRRTKFDAIKHMPQEAQYVALTALIEEFIAAGHNPRDPRDLMFQILGISPEFLESMLFALKAKIPVHTLDSEPTHEDGTAAEQAPEVTPAPVSKTA
jgi:hypothetical protein